MKQSSINSQKKIRKILSPDRQKSDNQIIVKSGINLSAQFATLCGDGTQLITTFNNVVHLIVSEKACPLLLRVLLDVQLSAGLRISELLKPTMFKVNYLGQIFIQGTKGSNSKLVTPLFFREYWQTKNPQCYNPFNHISRYSWHRLYKAYGIELHQSNDFNSKVTHTIRHLHVALMEIMELEEEDIAKILGHKSLTAIKYYTHGQKTKL